MPIALTSQIHKADNGKQQVIEISDEEDNYNPEEEQEIHFEPIVNLPLVEVVTGEEDEKVLFESKGQIFRFEDEEWHGHHATSIKVLQPKRGGKKRARIVVRREKVHKISVNHFVENIKSFELKDDLSCSWFVMADGGRPKVAPQYFSFRFPTTESRDKFFAVVKNASGSK
eukprot:Colp12_sorted_trinity150504_noHs@7811